MMSTIACPGCGGQFPLAQVAAYETFTCSSCGHVVKVPVAAPAPVVQPVQPARPAQPARPPQTAKPPQAAQPARPAQPAAQPARPAAQRPAAAPARAAQPAQRPAAARRAAPPPEPEPDARRRGGGRTRPARGGDDAPAKKGPPVGLLVGAGVVVVGGIAAFALTRDGGADLPPPQTIQQAAATQPAGTSSATTTPAASATEPVTPPKPAEPERIDVLPLIKQKLRECEFADEVSADPVYRLRLLMAKHTDKRGKWEAEGEQLAKVRKLLDETAAVDKKLRSSDAEMARAQWITYIRTIEVMKDYPMLHATVGPYLIFVQVKTEPGTTIDEADPEAIAKAQEILDRNKVLFEHFYEGWMTNIAPVFGFERYTEDNVEKETIFKATVFADHASYMQYNIRIGAGGTASSARAYYSKQEPRFICTYEGKAEKKEGEESSDDDGYSETREYIDHVQCHEATHQLVHFYTWDTTRKAIGRKPRWLDSLTRPLWSTEGFAEFFSSHEEKNGVFTWMVPLDNRMRELWVFQEIIQEKGWKPWELDQLLSLRNGGQLQSLGMARAIDPADRGAAVMVMANNFYAEAWSLNYFMWYAEQGGAPKWRDKLIGYYKQEFELDYGQKDGKSGDELARSPRLMLEGDFFRAMGIEDPAAQQAFYAEWKAWEKALLEKHRKPEWDKERARIRKMIGMKTD